MKVQYEKENRTKKNIEDLTDAQKNLSVFFLIHNSLISS